MLKICCCAHHPQMEVGMVDISKKEKSYRVAIAEGEVRLHPNTIKLIKDGKIAKGDPIQIAKIAGIQGAKMTPQLIPLCHPIPIEQVDLSFELLNSSIKVRAKVISHAKTGVEMEALGAVSVALLNLWDVVKAYEKDMSGQYPETSITDIRVLSKVKETDEESRRAQS